MGAWVRFWTAPGCHGGAPASVSNLACSAAIISGSRSSGKAPASFSTISTFGGGPGSSGTTVPPPSIAWAIARVEQGEVRRELGKKIANTHVIRFLLANFPAWLCSFG